MKIRGCAAVVALLLSSVFCEGVPAQPMPFNDAGVTMGHWHLNSRDVEANKKIFVAMGGVHTMLDGGQLADIVPTFGSVNMIGGECDR